jgi:hypothetical protein
MFLYDLAVPALPFAPRPFSDELLLSWICRLAAANQVGLSRFLPQVQAMGRYRLNWDPGEAVVAQLAEMARLPQSALQSLLLPNQFPNLSLLTFLQLPKLSSSFCGPSPTDFIPFPCCSDCAGNREFTDRTLYWQAEVGLLTTLLCPRHGIPVSRFCPQCKLHKLIPAWKNQHLIVRCSRCDTRPAAPPMRSPASLNPSGQIQMLFRLQSDIVAALRDQAPSVFWCGPITAIEFLGVVDDLYWLLRTPGLAVRCGKRFTFTEGFSWTSRYPTSRTLFTRTEHSHFSEWDIDSRAELLVAIAATMLGTRAFDIFEGRKPSYPEPTACSPWDWILPMLHTKGVKELMRRVSKWPLILQLPVTIVSRGLATGRVRRNVY